MNSLSCSSKCQIQQSNENNIKPLQNNHSSTLKSTIEGAQNYPAHNKIFKNLIFSQQQDQIISECYTNQQLNMKKYYSSEQVSFYVEKSISKIIECMEKLNIKCLQKQEIAVVILSYIIPYTPNIQEFSNFIIGFSINQSCFPNKNIKSLSEHINLIKNGVTEWRECIDVYSCFIKQIRETDNTASLQIFDQMHFFLLDLIVTSQKTEQKEIQLSYNQLQYRIKPSNTTFSHLSKITEKVKLSQTDYEIIKDMIEIYWIHEELFNNYSGEMCAYAILNILNSLNCTEADLSAFGDIDLLKQSHSVEWNQQYKQFYSEFCRISEIDIPEEQNIDIELDEQTPYDNKNIMQDDNIEEQQQIINLDDNLQNSSNHNLENKILEDLNVDQIVILNNDKNNLSYSKFKSNNTNQDEKSSNFQFQNSNSRLNDYVMSTPDKKTQSIINQNTSPLFTDSLGKQMNSSIFHTGETKSSSISNISMNTDSYKNSNFKPFCIKNPSPFNASYSSISNSCQ